MITIKDKVKLKKKTSKHGEKTYEYYFISFSTKYSTILSQFKEIYNVKITTEDGNTILLPKASLYIYSHQYNKTGEKTPQYSITIPKPLAEELWEKGQRKLKVIVELPDTPSEKYLYKIAKSNLKR